jgi:hypothetical protein
MQANGVTHLKLSDGTEMTQTVKPVFPEPSKAQEYNPYTDPRNCKCGHAKFQHRDGQCLLGVMCKCE